jgi:hypothetical protein
VAMEKTQRQVGIVENLAGKKESFSSGDGVSAQSRSDECVKPCLGRTRWMSHWTVSRCWSREYNSY